MASHQQRSGKSTEDVVLYYPTGLSIAEEIVKNGFKASQVHDRFGNATTNVVLHSEPRRIYGFTGRAEVGVNAADVEVSLDLNWKDIKQYDSTLRGYKSFSSREWTIPADVVDAHTRKRAVRLPQGTTGLLTEGQARDARFRLSEERRYLCVGGGYWWDVIPKETSRQYPYKEYCAIRVSRPGGEVTELTTWEQVEEFIRETARVHEERAREYAQYVADKEKAEKTPIRHFLGWCVGALGVGLLLLGAVMWVASQFMPGRPYLPGLGRVDVINELSGVSTIVWFAGIGLMLVAWKLLR